MQPNDRQHHQKRDETAIKTISEGGKVSAASFTQTPMLAKQKLAAIIQSDCMVSRCRGNPQFYAHSCAPHSAHPDFGAFSFDRGACLSYFPSFIPELFHGAIQPAHE